MTSSYNWLFKCRFVKTDEFRLVEFNGIPELVPFSAVAQRRKKILNFTDSGSTIGIFKQASALIGSNGHYVVNVPPGQFAKIYNGARARLLGSGQHVIITNNFQFNPATDLVNQNTAYIQHNNIHVMRVPPGKIAIVNIDNVSYFLESRKDPYVFKTLQFDIIKPANNQLFHDANAKVLRAGNAIRIIPDIGEIGVVNTGGKYKFLEPGSEQNGPIIQDIGNGRFDGFMSKNFENVQFPSAETRAQHLAMGVSEEECNFHLFYTGDSVPVGVRFFVSYKITNPELALESLKFNDIKRHIECVVNADMGNAIKQTSNQNLLSSNLSQPLDDSAGTTINYNHWQDLVKSKLKTDLAEFGIELIRLNIDEAKILNPKIEQQMSQQAITVAEAHARKLALQVNLDIGTQEAAQRRTLALQKQKTDGELLKLDATSKLEAAEIDAKAMEIRNEVELGKQRGQAEVLRSSPEAMLLAFLNKFVEALQNGNFTAALPLSDLNQLLSSCLEKITKMVSSEHKIPSIVQSAEGLFANNDSLLDEQMDPVLQKASRLV